jgi:hypothetical protein
LWRRKESKNMNKNSEDKKVIERLENDKEKYR